MATIRLPPDFKEFLQRLNERGVEYLLIGGYAVAHYGHIRATNDIDVWIAIDPENANRVAEAVRDFGFAEVTSEMFSSPNRIVRMGVPPLQIEVATSIDGVEFEECFEQRGVVEIDGITVNLISLEHLRHNKRASGRLKDLSDLEHLPEA